MQEKRNYLIGKMFAYNCIIRSKVLLKDESHAAGLPMVIREVCELGKQASSSWLKEECGLVCYEAARLMCRELPDVNVACSIIDAMNNCNALKTPEGILVWLEFSSHIEGAARKFPKGIWHKHNPLSGKEIGTLVKILHLVKSSDEETSDPSGSRQTSPHFAWDVILQHLMRTDGHKSKGEDDDKAKALKNYKQFWTEAIDSE
jgi:DNA polymerase phi